uniref:galactose-specific lectin nattectin-like n=1 Tax=Scatophagus argus TaxID=75038 RepID=UPI001ED80E0B|nr:galactose-specific lectin nattectin-like [Scatophagus argus]
MRPLVVSAILLLVSLMHMAEANEATIARICKERYPQKECPGSKEWFQLDDKRCMKVTTQRMTFPNAERHCKSQGGHLVSIHNVDHYNRVLCYVFSISREQVRFWIGARRGSHGFYWVDGSGHMTFSRWARLQPDWRPGSHWFNREHCVEMNYETWGHWNDENCNSRRAFMCAKNM